MTIEKIPEELKREVYLLSQKYKPEELAAAALSMQISADNAMNGSLTGYDCPECKNKGKIYYQSENGEEFAAECPCMNIRRTLSAAQNSGLAEYIHKTFEDYQTAEPWQKAIYGKAAEYIKDNSNAWFIITGQTGAGKTLICSIIAHELLFKQKKDLQYIVWTEFIGEIKRDMTSDRVSFAADKIKRAKTAEVLFIDELFKAYSSADLKYFSEIINYRYARRLKTLVTSELDMDELYRIDGSCAGRMYERANKGGYYTHIEKNPAKNYRMR